MAPKTLPVALGLLIALVAWLALLPLWNGEPDDPIARLNRALAESPRSPKLYAARGRAYQALNERALALEDFERAAELAPDDAAILVDRANVYWSFGRSDEALRDLDRATELQPDLAAAYFHRGNIQFALTAYAGALADFGDAIRLSPGEPGPYFNRARTFRKLGYLKHAIRDMETFTELSGDESKLRAARESIREWRELVRD